MSVLRRFPVSDEFISYRKTLDSVCDRMKFFDVNKMETFGGRYGNVGNDLAHRVEVLSGACGASFRSKSSREVRIGHKRSFFQSFRKFGKWEVPKKRPGSIGGLAVALYLGTVQVPRENLAWCGFG